MIFPYGTDYFVLRIIHVLKLFLRFEKDRSHVVMIFFQKPNRVTTGIEDFVHIVLGRTARGGAEGKAVYFLYM